MARPLRLLVFQHIAIEHPGIFREFLHEDQVAWDAVELDEGDVIPDLSDYDALWVMGGPMDVWEEADNPWLVAEKAAIREAVRSRQMPYLGVCLGHQLLADALGGEVGVSETPEVGILGVELTDAGRDCRLFRGIDTRVRCLQWHGAEVRRPPPDAIVLASSPVCAVQAMQVGDRAFSVQYHVELTSTTIREWGEVPAYDAALKKTLGNGALERFVADGDAHMSAFNRDARLLYDNFMSIVKT